MPGPAARAWWTDAVVTTTTLVVDDDEARCLPAAVRSAPAVALADLDARLRWSRRLRLAPEDTLRLVARLAPHLAGGRDTAPWGGAAWLSHSGTHVEARGVWFVRILVGACVALRLHVAAAAGTASPDAAAALWQAVVGITAGNAAGRW